MSKQFGPIHLYLKCCVKTCDLLVHCRRGRPIYVNLLWVPVISQRDRHIPEELNALQLQYFFLANCACASSKNLPSQTCCRQPALLFCIKHEFTDLDKSTSVARTDWDICLVAVPVSLYVCAIIVLYIHIHSSQLPFNQSKMLLNYYGTCDYRLIHARWRSQGGNNFHLERNYVVLSKTKRDKFYKLIRN